MAQRFPGTIWWDFDGTLGERPGLWSVCLVDTLASLGHPGIPREAAHVYLSKGFPWHHPEIGHEDWGDADDYWRHLAPLLLRAAAALAPDVPADDIVANFRRRYCDPTGWRLFPETVKALESVRRAGSRNVVVSNHVPELRSIIAALGLDPWLDEIVCSAEVGWEKPNRRIFLAALGDADPADVAMIGDNETADVLGPAALNVRGFLVHKTTDSAPPLSLTDALRVVGLPAERASSEPSGGDDRHAGGSPTGAPGKGGR